MTPPNLAVMANRVSPLEALGKLVRKIPRAEGDAG